MSQTWAVTLRDCVRAWSKWLPGNCLGPLEGIWGRSKSIKKTKGEYGDGDRGMISICGVGSAMPCWVVRPLKGLGEDTP